MRKKDPELRIGHRLAALRAGRGMSQGTVARLAGIAPSYLSRVENARVEPTFPTLWRILRALRADLSALVGPETPSQSRRGGCPVSRSGHCLLDLVRSDQDVARDDSRQMYSAREVRLLGRLASWMKAARPERIRALEVLLEALIEAPP